MAKSESAPNSVTLKIQTVLSMGVIQLSVNKHTMQFIIFHTHQKHIENMCISRRPCVCVGLIMKTNDPNL